MADLPIKELGDEAPEYDRPFVSAAKPKEIDADGVKAPLRHHRSARKRFSARPIFARKRWVWEQYDHVILGNTVQRPGGDAAVVRIEEGPKALALTTDVTPRYCEADPFEGGKQAVAECWRNFTAVGAKPLAITDNLNFGNPERPEIMGQFVGCIRGIAEACKVLDFPVVSGNVSLYNETNGRAILPTPTIGGVGLIDDFTKSATLVFKRADETILLVGETTGWLGQSIYLRDVCRREEGAPPPVDLTEERENGDFVRALILDGTATAVHDLSDGGLLVGACRDGDGVRHRRNPCGRADRHPRPRSLVRRGSGALSRDSACGAVVPTRIAPAAPMCRRVDGRQDRGRHIDACGRASHPGHDSARAF